MKALNISAREAADLKELPENTVLISINEENEPLYHLNLDRNSVKILTINFFDITANREYKGRIINPINEEKCFKILNFINLNREKDFIVHCAAGVSRSSAICLYLHLTYGHELKQDFYKTSRPNPFVLGKLLISRHQTNL